MKTMFVAVFAIVLAACNQPTPAPQPKPAPTTAQARPSLFVPHATFQQLPADAEFPPLPVETPDSRTRPATKRVNAIVWDLLSGSFYVTQVAAGNLTNGWAGPGVLGTTLENSRMVMICARACNRWPIPEYAGIEISSFPAKASAMYEQPPWVEKREAAIDLDDAFVLDVATGNRYAYRFLREFRDGLGTGWFFGPISSGQGTRVVGICFQRCNEQP